MQLYTHTSPALTHTVLLSRATLSLAIMAGIDLLLSSLFAALAYLLTGPLAPLHCQALPNLSTPQAEEAWLATLQGDLGKFGVGQWAGQERSWCYATKAVWGVGMGLCALFAASAVVLIGLFAKGRRAAMGGGLDMNMGKMSY